MPNGLIASLADPYIGLLIATVFMTVKSDIIYTVFQKNPCDYVFDDNLNSKRPIVIIFGTVIT